MKLTNNQRARVVRMLRCAADVISLTRADVVPKRGTLGWVAWEAKRAVQASLSPARRRIVEFDFGEPRRWLYLEAAARVEEGALP